MISALSKALGPSKVLEGDETLLYARDESEVEGMLPDGVVLAECTQDIVKTLEIAQRYPIPVTPRAGGTGRTGGAIPVQGGIVLATHALSVIKDIDRPNQIAVVEPGVTTGQLHRAVEQEGLFYPPDPNSLASCQIGGNLAENAAGPRAFKYGVTRDYVLGVEVCLMGGRVLRTGRRTSKGVTGYDITALLVGSEGTLGIFTEATLQLVPKPPAVATLLAYFKDIAASARAVVAIGEAQLVPRCIEWLDYATLQALRTEGYESPSGARAMLLVEVDGDPSWLDAELERVGNAISSVAGLLQIVVALTEEDRERLWGARRLLSRATRRLARYKISEDVVVPRTLLPQILSSVDRIGDRTEVQHLAYGHAGDGNLHVNFLWNEEREKPLVFRAVRELMEETVRLGGTLSGEHGIGGAKKEYIGLEQSPELITLQQDLKRVFDPAGLLNPGKIFPSRGHFSC
ncbi:FAD-binding oxidoreductase [Pajaroellobacter abortibovis]|uniref:FAD-binding oxidoreductase n=1 Tax=Pajaroellobacter abortibovis TaxID=1882918 RepID=UPI0012EBB169|nr:FAD-linked oxidase C-terminal domain-containing protein [Pajaroellobacter abortibovis]